MYATRANMEAAYSVDDVAMFADRERDDGPDYTSIDAALTEASNLIDGYIGARYPLPLAQPAPILTRPCIDIAVYHLATSHTLMTETIAERYKAAIKLLEQIARGLVKLPIDSDGDGQAESANVIIREGGADRLFTRDSLRDL